MQLRVGNGLCLGIIAVLFIAMDVVAQGVKPIAEVDASEQIEEVGMELEPPHAGEVDGAKIELADAERQFAHFIQEHLTPELPLAEERFWQDADLKYSVRGTVVGIDDKVVQIRKRDGKVVAVQRVKLCKSDVLYLSTRFDDYVHRHQVWKNAKNQYESLVALSHSRLKVATSNYGIAMARYKEQVALIEVEAARRERQEIARQEAEQASRTGTGERSGTGKASDADDMESSSLKGLSSYRSSARSSARETARSGVITGPRGGRYYINKNGNKTYIKRK